MFACTLYAFSILGTNHSRRGRTESAKSKYSELGTSGRANIKPYPEYQQQDPKLSPEYISLLGMLTVLCTTQDSYTHAYIHTHMYVLFTTASTHPSGNQSAVLSFSSLILHSLLFSGKYALLWIVTNGARCRRIFQQHRMLH